MTHTERRVAPGIWQLKKDLFNIRVRGKCPRTGKMTARWRKFEGSKAEALMARENWRAEIEEGELTAKRETLSAFAASWLSTKLSRGDLRASTARRYAESLDLHILPALGDVYVDALTVHGIEAALTQWAGKYESSTANSWLRVLRTVLATACAEQLIASNPAVSVHALREGPDEEDDDDDGELTNALTPTQLGDYLSSWHVLYPSDYPLVATLGLTGLRWGECTALKWSDIESAEQSGALRVRRSHVRGVVRGSTKTGRKRVVPFPDVLCDVLKRYRQALVVEQHLGLAEGWVFPNTEGKLRANGQLSARNREVLKHAKIGRHVTIHGLRRTVTDLLRRAAVDPVAAKAIIGHETDRMRQHYSSVGADEALAIGNRVVALVPGLSRSEKEPSNGRNDGRTASEAPGPASDSIL